MHQQAGLWLKLTLGSFLLVCPRCMLAQNPPCGPGELEGSFSSSAKAYPDSIALSETLSKHRISVKCILRSKMEGTFEDQDDAALYRTDHGDFEVLFLPRPKTFDHLRVIEKRNRQRYTYRFEGPPQPWPANRIDSAFRIYFIKNGNMLFVVEANKRFAETLKEMVRSEHK